MTTSVVTIGFTNQKPARAHFLRGPIRAAIEAQLRENLKPWGLPLRRYRCTVERFGTPSYQDNHGQWQGWWETIPVCATFINRNTGAKICITEIRIDDDGKILQYGSQYGDLTL